MQFSRKPKPKMLCLLKESVLYQICKCINEYLIHNMVNFPKKLVLTYVGWAFPAVTKGVGVKYPIDFFLLFFSLLSFFQKKLCIKKLCILLTFFFFHIQTAQLCASFPVSLWCSALAEQSAAADWDPFGASWKVAVSAGSLAPPFLSFRISPSDKYNY